MRLHAIDEVLWDVDGTIVPGDGLEYGQCLLSCVEDPDRLTAMLRALRPVNSSIASRNAQFDKPSTSLLRKAASLGFNGVVLDLLRKRSVPKQSPTGRRALLIDNSLHECRRALKSNVVVVALHLCNNKGFFATIDNGHYSVLTNFEVTTFV